jgi:hypothetical protein
MLKLILAASLLTLSACAGLPTSQENTALDRLKPKAADHAEALAGADVESMRETGLELLETLAAYAGW